MAGKSSSASDCRAVTEAPDAGTPSTLGHPCIEQIDPVFVNRSQPPSVPAAAELSTTAMVSRPERQIGATSAAEAPAADAVTVADGVGVPAGRVVAVDAGELVEVHASSRPQQTMTAMALMVL